MEQKDSVVFWEKEIKAGEDFKKKFAEAEQWDNYTQYYRNKFAPGILPINLIYSIGRSVIPQVYLKNPGVTVTPTQPGYWVQSQLLEGVHNNLIRTLKLKKQIRKTILRTFLYGTGPFKTGFDTEYGYNLEHPRDQNIEEEKIEFNPFIRPGMPWALSVLPSNYITPWGISDFDEKSWECFICWRLLESVKNDPKYSEVKKDIKATYTLTGEKKGLFSFGKGVAEWVKLFEIHDFRDGKIKVFAEDSKEWLRYDDDPTQLGGSTTPIVVFNDDPEVAWGVADCVVIDPQQKEANEIRTQEMQHRRIALMKFFYDKTKLTPTEVDKMLSANVGPGVGVDGPPANSVMILQPHIPPDFQNSQISIRGDVRETVGFNRNQMGEYDISSRRTATETEYVARAAGIRVDERRDMIADALVDIVVQWNKLIFAYWTDEKIDQVVGPDGVKYWVSFQGKELMGDYVFKVDPESQMPMNRMVRREDALKLLAQFKDDPLVPNQIELRRWVANQFEGFDVEKLFSPPEGTAGQIGSPIPMQALQQKFPPTGGEGLMKEIPMELLKGGLGG